MVEKKKWTNDTLFVTETFTSTKDAVHYYYQWALLTYAPVGQWKGMEWNRKGWKVERFHCLDLKKMDGMK